jgi:hypothetical protein
MAASKSPSTPAPILGFSLDELATQMEPGRASSAATDVPSPSPLGRPRTLTTDAQPFSVRLSPRQRDWLLKTAAQRQLETGERCDTSQIVRELIDQALSAT